MRIPALLTMIMFFALSLTGCNKAPTTSTRSVAASTPQTAPSVAAQDAPKFTSEYTDLKKCGSGMTKKEEKEAEEQGSDIPTRCKGPGGYDIFIYYSACASIITAVKGEERISLATQVVDWQQKTVEWRMIGGKPFAVIMRVYKYAGDDPCTSSRKVIGESLVVKGLKGYEHIDGSVDVKTTPDANVRAREIADKGYGKG